MNYWVCDGCGKKVAESIKVCPHCKKSNKPIINEEIAREKEREKWVNAQKRAAVSPRYRKCSVCGFTGEMKTWLGSYMAPQLIFVALLIPGLVPAFIFMAVFWNKYKCPSCGTIGKNAKSTVNPELAVEVKTCRFCDETIKSAAKVCKHCGKEQP